MMITDVPPNETLALKNPVHIIGINAMMSNPTAPTNTM